ncbi:hypothetical protein N8987_06570 [Crocinitomix sp.]|nr:hypothetical protein [Crocinitomix sp.]
MIAVKKGLVCLFCFIAIGAFSQVKGDIGMLVSSDYLMRVGLEYRAPINEHYNWKIGVTGGSQWVNTQNREIVSATDSTVIMAHNSLNSEQIGLRFGVERQLKGSVFSVGLDLNIGYLVYRYDRRNYAEGLDSNGRWVYADILSEEEFASGVVFEPGYERPIAIGDYDFADINRNYLNTDLRFSLNLDIPIGDSFLFHGSISGVFGMPIYMGATNVNDPNNRYLGIPPSVFNFSQNVNVGLRYKIGSRKK